MDNLDKNTTALVVIDLQKGITLAPAQPHEAKVVIANAALLAQAFRKNRMPVFLIRVTPSADGKDRLAPITDENSARGIAQLPPDWADLVPELDAQPGDFVITKRHWGAFYGTELDLQLRRRKIETIVLCGIATDIGVESTARFAYEYGYQQIFVEDATSARAAGNHEHTFTAIFPRIGRVRKTQDILEALK